MPRLATAPAPPPLDLSLLRPGMRLGVAVSGGADSVALLRLLHNQQTAQALSLTVLHVHHGIRGQEADRDAQFTEELARSLGCHFLLERVNTPELAREARQGLEEAAREQRYAWFRSLTDAGSPAHLQAVATAHTADDQAETVLHRLLRGAWTDGLGAIQPVLRDEQGRAIVLRPLLQASRASITAWLQALGQPWQQDSTNLDLQYTRNRIRHTLLPALRELNPAISTQLAHMAELAREDATYWDAEVARVLPSVALPGRPTRGGGRSSSTHPAERTLSFELERLRPLAPALVRRLLRAAAAQLGSPLDFDQTRRLYNLLQSPGSTTGRTAELTARLSAERTPRELRLHATERAPEPAPARQVDIPGTGEHGSWQLSLGWVGQPGTGHTPTTALLRSALPSDRVQLRYSRGAPKKIKEVLERMGVPPGERAGWPVVEYGGEIVAVAGAVLEPSALSSQLTIVFSRRET